VLAVPHARRSPALADSIIVRKSAAWAVPTGHNRKKRGAGQVFLNDYGAGGGVELPFGGVGRSGHGRQKGMAALESFSALKTVIAHHG
jgi:acyl-CoA reductase-like NAD-dependent aldehyde dehydrogenase